jgi:hypothetical protein
LLNDSASAALHALIFEISLVVLDFVRHVVVACDAADGVCVSNAMVECRATGDMGRWYSVLSVWHPEIVTKGL